MKCKRITVMMLLLIFVFSLTALAAPTPGLGVNDMPNMVIKTITLTSPNGGEVWQGGIERTITWKYIPTAFKAKSVQILLLKGNQVVSTIAQSTPVGSNGQGSFKWSTLNVAPGTDYRIKIIGLANTAVAPIFNKNAQTDSSDYFTISEKAKITITLPQSAGQTFSPGQPVTITWNYTGDIGSTLFLRMIHGSDYPNGGLFSVLINPNASAGNGGHGSYNWVIPDKVDGADIPTSATYFFDIGCEYAGVGASGKAFKIINSKTPPPTIKVTSPNGGQIWHKGSTYNITWSYTGSPGPEVIIMLIPKSDPVSFTKIAEHVPIGTNGSGSFSWKIPYDVERRTDYQIWVGNGAYSPNFIDASDNTFVIDEFVK